MIGHDSQPVASVPLERKVGLIAGWGRYPLVLAQSLERQGMRTYCLGVREHADPELAQICTSFRWMGIGRLGRAVRFFRRHGVRQATMAGKIHKSRLFGRGAWLRHLPDWRTIRRFARHFLFSRRDRRDDTLLLAVVDEFASAGITLAAATDFAPEFLVQLGQLTRRGPTGAQKRDIAYGWQLAKLLGQLDAGQSVAIKAQTALAVEAIEGTDECIRRAGSLCTAGGFTVVKVAKPRQDMRFDVPTVGMGTLDAMARAGAACLAIEAGSTIMIDQPDLIRFADEHQLAIVAVGPDCIERSAPETVCESRER